MTSFNKLYTFNNQKGKSTALDYRKPLQWKVNMCLLMFALFIERTIYILFSAHSSLHTLSSSRYIVNIITSITWSILIIVSTLKYYHILSKQIHAWNPQDTQSWGDWQPGIDNTYSNQRVISKLNRISLFCTISIISISMTYFILSITSMLQREDLFILRNIIQFTALIIAAFTCYIGISFNKYAMKARQFFGRHLPFIDGYNILNEILVYIAWICLTIFARPLARDDDRNGAIIHYIWGCIMILILCYIKTRLPLRLRKKLLGAVGTLDKYQMYFKGEYWNSDFYVGRRRNSDSWHDGDYSSWNSNNMLQTKLSAELYMHHCRAEFSVEINMFFMELAKIKYEYYMNNVSVIKYHFWNTDDRGKFIGTQEIAIDFREFDFKKFKYTLFYHTSIDSIHCITIYPQMPINKQIDYEQTVYEQMRQIYHKYIKDDAEWCINIRCTTRNYLTKCFESNENDNIILDISNDIDANEEKYDVMDDSNVERSVYDEIEKSDDTFWINCMDDAIFQMVGLQKDTFNRFKRNTEFELMKRQLGDDGMRHNLSVINDRDDLYDVVLSGILKIKEPGFIVGLIKNEEYKIAAMELYANPIAGLQQILGQSLCDVVLQYWFGDY